jgi:hypothetical protein
MRTHKNPPLLSQITDPPLLDRITSPPLHCEESPINTTKSSQLATTSLISTDKERYQKCPCMQQFKTEFLKQMESLLQTQRQVSNLLLKQLKTTMLKCPMHKREETVHEGKDKDSEPEYEFDDEDNRVKKPKVDDWTKARTIS